MFNIVLILILALHAAPFGLNLMEYATSDLYIVTNLIIQVLLAGCLIAKAAGKWEQFFSFLVLVVSVFFLLNYAIDEDVKKAIASQPNKWISHDNR